VVDINAELFQDFAALDSEAPLARMRHDVMGLVSCQFHERFV
jgi:hypothetical protein